MVSPEDLDRQTGLFATARLVGRDKQLGQILEIIKRPSGEAHGIVVIDDGGMGKTKLLEEVLKEAQKDSGLYAASEVIDFYHMSPHIRYGLADAMYNALKLKGKASRKFDELREEVENRRVFGDTSGYASARERAVSEFIQILKALTSDRKVVIALDTAERLLYGAGLLQPPLDDVADSWKWFRDDLLNATKTHLNNFVFLLAGRPAARRLTEDLERVLSGGWTQVPLGPLEPEYASEFFDALAEAARSSEAPDVASRIAGLDTDKRQLVHSLSGGRPIFLTLLADFAALQYPLPNLLETTLGQVQKLPDQERAKQAKELERELVTRLISQKPLGDTILALGRVPKGANADLLAAIINPKAPDISDASLRLAQFSRLSIARLRHAEEPKERPHHNRYFLHDEMYRLLKEYVYDNPVDRQEAKRAAEAIEEYYRNQLDECRKQFDVLWEPTETKGLPPNMNRLSIVSKRRRLMLTESVYYYLKSDPRRGFRHYYRASREATLSGETEVDFRLEAIILDYWAEHQADKNGNGKLDASQVKGVVAMRPIVRAWAEQKYDDAMKEAQRLREEGQAILNEGAPVSEAILTTWEAYILTSMGGENNLEIANKKLDDVIAQLKPLLSSTIEPDLESPKLWRMKAVVGLAYRVRGYLHRNRGELGEAINDYSQAARLWRQLNIQVEQAQTLNDLGYALTLMGRFGDARTLVNDAINLRRTLGPRYPVGLSKNTLALVDLYEGLYEGAQKKAEQALAMFTVLRHERGRGLALLALAESKRRYSQTDDVPDPEAKIELLRAARDDAEEALSIFEKVNEQPHVVEALIEMGCALRDWIQVRRTQKRAHEDLKEMYGQSEKHLQRAAELAGTGLLYRKVDALVNLAWLRYYASQAGILEKGDIGDKVN